MRPIRSPPSRPSSRYGAATPRPKCIPTVRELGIGYVAYSPLGRGFLTGQFKSPDDFAEDDFRNNHPRFQGENFEKNIQLVRAVEKMAQEKGCTTAQLALAWVLAQGEDIVPIPGTRHVKYLDENIGALDVKLTSTRICGGSTKSFRPAPQPASAITSAGWRPSTSRGARRSGSCR